MFSRTLSLRSLLDVLVMLMVVLLFAGTIRADDQAPASCYAGMEIDAYHAKARRDRDAAAALALQLAIDDGRPARDAAASAALSKALVPLAVEFLKVRADGWHVHQCPTCAAQWSHKDTAFGNLSEHSCPAPGCNGVSWTPLETNVKIIERLTPVPVPSVEADPFFITADVDAADDDDEPIQFFAAPCPGGNCPTASRTVTRTYIPGPVTRTVKTAVPATVTIVRAAPAVVSRSVMVFRNQRPVGRFMNAPVRTLANVLRLRFR